jgi:hypothetical protein
LIELITVCKTSYSGLTPVALLPSFPNAFLVASLTASADE